MRALAILAALAMLISLMLPWLNLSPQGASITPLNLFRAIDPDIEAIRQFIAGSRVELVAFLVTFILAALFLLMALFNLPSRGVAILGGGLGTGLIGYTAWQISNNQADLPVPVSLDFGNTQQIAEVLGSVPGYGAWAWAAGAVILLISGLVGYSRS